MNQHSKDRRKLFSFAAWLGASFVVSGAVRLIAVGIVGRALGPETFGRLQYATSLYLYFFAFAEFGLVTLGTVRIAREPALARAYGRIIVTALLLMSAASLVVLLCLAPFIAPTESAFLMVYGVGLIVHALSLEWALRGLGRMGAVAVFEVVRSLSYLGAVVLLVSKPDHALRVVFLQVGAAALAAAGLALYYKRVTSPVASGSSVAVEPPDPGFARAAIAAAAPIAAGQIVAIFYGQCDLIALRWLASAAAVGYYAPGVRMLLPLNQLVSLALQAWLPVLASSYSASRERFSALLVELLEGLAWLIIPGGIAGWLMVPWLLELFFGAGYLPGAASFRGLVLAFGVLCIRSPLSMAFLAVSREWHYLGVTSLATVVRTASVMVLVPPLGVEGAALGVLLGELSFFVGSLSFLRVVGSGRLLVAYTGPAVSGCAAVLSLYLIPVEWGSPRWVVAASLYGVGFWGLAWPRFRRLLRLLRAAGG